MKFIVARLAYASAVFVALTTATYAMNARGLASPPTLPHDTALLWLAQIGAGKIFSGTGVVTAIQPAGSLTINHEPIEGLMPAMEMMFSVNPRALTNGVRPGDKVEFNVDGKTFTIVALTVHGHSH